MPDVNFFFQIFMAVEGEKFPKIDGLKGPSINDVKFMMENGEGVLKIG